MGKILAMKNEMAEKINEATEIYQKGLEMMQKTAEVPGMSAKFAKGSSQFEEYMASAVAAPSKSTVIFC